jgi:hypothetical protein
MEPTVNRMPRFTTLPVLATATAAAALSLGLTTAAPAAADVTSVTRPAIPITDVPDPIAHPQLDAQWSDNMQYLQTQAQMQNDNRQYAAVSNIMKTKHDTVKNSVNNVR